MTRQPLSFELEFGQDRLRLDSPVPVDILALKTVPALPDPQAAIRVSLESPVAGPSLSELTRSVRRRRPDAEAVIVISDNTRPVPYRGEDGILEPVFDSLHREGIRHVTVLVATGTHRSLRDEELRRMLPEQAFHDPVKIINHDCRDASMLRHLGRTARGTEVWINRFYLDADLQILTGLAEPHFMAGISGGPKAICPGLVGEDVTYGFHSAAMMANTAARSLNLEGNPCQEEARAVAAMAGSDFAVNVTLNRDKRLTGVFCGTLDAVHRAACKRVMAESGIAMEHEYDVVVTHAGFAGINHYQAAKAAVEASRAVKAGGVLILAANHTDADPVGGANYKQVLPMLKDLGPDEFDRKMLSPAWKFVPEQWEVQMWGRVFRKLGPLGQLIYCSPQLTGTVFSRMGLPGVDGGIGVGGLVGRDLAEAMVQKALSRVKPGASVAVLTEGPYGVPMMG